MDPGGPGDGWAQSPIEYKPEPSTLMQTGNKKVYVVCISRYIRLTIANTHGTLTNVYLHYIHYARTITVLGYMLKIKDAPMVRIIGRIW